jgi:hypothetical protein
MSQAVNHLEDVKGYIQSVMASKKVHMVILEGPHGFAKTYTVRQAIDSLNLEAKVVKGSITPLEFYNTLCTFPDSLIVLDDCIGLFENEKAVSILKAATWGDGEDSTRQVNWFSTSKKVKEDEVEFTGKFIILCNAIPMNAHTKAMLSRSWKYPIHFDKEERIEALLAAKRGFHKHNPDAHEVIDFILDVADHIDEDAINFRTIDSGLELKRTAGPAWKNLFIRVLPKSDSPKEVVRKLALGKNPIKVQVNDFIRLTGKKRRTFFTYRDELGLRVRARRDKTGFSEDMAE